MRWLASGKPGESVILSGVLASGDSGKLAMPREGGAVQMAPHGRLFLAREK